MWAMATPRTLSTEWTSGELTARPPPTETSVFEIRGNPIPSCPVLLQPHENRWPTKHTNINTYQFRIHWYAGLNDLASAWLTSMLRNTKIEFHQSSCVYHDTHCDIWPWAWAIQLYCSAWPTQPFSIHHTVKRLLTFTMNDNNWCGCGRWRPTGRLTAQVADNLVWGWLLPGTESAIDK